MMKIGLCVRYDCNNFGSMLQILATQKMITRFGGEYEIIRYDKKTPFFMLTNITRIFNPYFMRGKIKRLEKQFKIRRYPDICKGNQERVRRIGEYRKKYIGPYSAVRKGYGQLVRGAEEYDAVMVGSDQLWTPAGIKSKFYNLLFVPDNVRKISFATSFGVSRIPRYQEKMTRRYLERMEYIGVREIGGAGIIRQLTGRDVLVALDPTLLYTGEEWNEMFPEEKKREQPYIFAYFLGSNAAHREAVKSWGRSIGLPVVTIPFMDEFVECDLEFGEEQLYDVDPVDFLNFIRGAEYICTDSFHGSVFSILSHKQFMTFNRTDNNDKQTSNSRIDSLFELLGLQERRYHPEINLAGAMKKAIDYNAVEEKLAGYRRETFDFLKEALGRQP